MSAGVGHNSGDVLNQTAQSQLKSILERIEHLDDERGAIMEAMKQVYAEAKGNGFDNKTIRKIVTIRRKDVAKFKEEQAMLDLYAHALGLDLF